MIIWLFVFAALLVAIGGFLAAFDSAASSLSRAEVIEVAEKSRARKSLLHLADDFWAHVNAVNFSRVVFETGAAVLVTLAFAAVFENWWVVLLVSVLAMTAASFVLVGVSPRGVGRAHPEAVVRIGAPFAHAVRVVLGPLVGALIAISNRVTPGLRRQGGVSSEEQLLNIVDEAAELDVLEDDDRELIHSIFEFGETLVREVMVPRTDMVTIEESATVAQAYDIFFAEGVSRIPVTGEDSDDVVGVLYLRDLSQWSHRNPGVETVELVTISRPAQFIPDSKMADEALKLMQADSSHISIVIDEYGGVAGLVTLEDLIEELVGDIEDEHDRTEVTVEDLGEGRYRVAPRLSLSDLGDVLDRDIEDEEVDSVGGLITKELGRFAEIGDTVEVQGLMLTADKIVGKDKNLASVMVTVIAPEPEDDASAALGSGAASDTGPLFSEPGMKGKK